MKLKSPYRVQAGEILDVIEETPNIKTFVVRPQQPLVFKTGQFIEFGVFGKGEAPFTPSSSHFKTDVFEITIMKVGYVTEWIHRLKPGDVATVRGPYGRGYPIEEWVNKDVLIVGGGVGLAPLRSLLLTLLDERKKYGRIILCYGARTPTDLVYKSYLKKWKKSKDVEVFISVDREEGSTKFPVDKVGVVTTLLDLVKINKKNTVAAVCGPPIMMKFTTLKLLDMGIPEERIYLSMEKKMYCGIGHCRHCLLGSYFVCKDGPVFTYDKIKNVEGIWD